MGEIYGIEPESASQLEEGIRRFLLRFSFSSTITRDIELIEIGR
jgi:hypothetical protein